MVVVPSGYRHSMGNLELTAGSMRRLIASMAAAGEGSTAGGAHKQGAQGGKGKGKGGGHHGPDTHTPPTHTHTHTSGVTRMRGARRTLPIPAVHKDALQRPNDGAHYGQGGHLGLCSYQPPEAHTDTHAHKSATPAHLWQTVGGGGDRAAQRVAGYNCL